MKTNRILLGFEYPNFTDNFDHMCVWAFPKVIVHIERIVLSFPSIISKVFLVSTGLMDVFMISCLLGCVSQSAREAERKSPADSL